MQAMNTFLNTVKNIYISRFTGGKKSVQLCDCSEGGGLVPSVHLLEFLIVVVICGLLIIGSLAEIGW